LLSLARRVLLHPRGLVAFAAPIVALCQAGGAKTQAGDGNGKTKAVDFMLWLQVMIEP
jgi:hypothetical protein